MELNTQYSPASWHFIHIESKPNLCSSLTVTDYISQIQLVLTLRFWTTDEKKRL